MVIRPPLGLFLAEVQAITLGRGPFRSIVLHLGPWDLVSARKSRMRLHYGTGGILVRRSQERVRAQIESWWLEHRGAGWQPTVPPEPLRFPSGVDPFAPPPHE